MQIILFSLNLGTLIRISKQPDIPWKDLFRRNKNVKKMFSKFFRKTLCSNLNSNKKFIFLSVVLQVLMCGSWVILNTNVLLATVQPWYLIIYHISQSLKMQKIHLSTKLTIQPSSVISGNPVKKIFMARNSQHHIF